MSARPRTAQPTTAPAYVIGLDFGTTFSGFAYAVNKAVPSKIADLQATSINTVHEWPEQAQIFFNYPKTATALFYQEADKKPLWGWPARIQAMKAPDQTPGQHQHRFKLHLAGKHEYSSLTNLPPLPDGKAEIDVIADFLHLISRFALDTINNTGAAVQMKNVKWCLTVPATWDQSARVKMEEAAVKAGMIANADGPDNGGSHHSLAIILEPEAASVYCFNMTQNETSVKSLNESKPYLIVDCGGGTVDLVVHAKTANEGSTFALREMAPGSGGLCGGTFVDDEFRSYVRSKAPSFDKWAKDVRMPLSLRLFDSCFLFLEAASICQVHDELGDGKAPV